MLTLPIKKKWFDMIISGEKKEEYRKRSPHYGDLLRKYLWMSFDEASQSWKKAPLVCKFRNGVRADSPAFVAVCTVDIGEGRPEWGAEPGVEYYRLHIDHVIAEPEEVEG